MAFSHLKHISLIFLIVSLFSVVPIEARVSKFFSKFVSEPVTPVSTPPELSPTPTPTSAPAPAPVFEDESQNAYGLYSRDFNAEKTPTLTDVEDEILAEDSGEESYKSGEGNYRGNEYETREREGMSDARFYENEKNYYGRNGENYDNGYVSRGRSDEKERGFYGRNDEYPKYEFDSMEEYENYQKNQKRHNFIP